MKKCALGGVDDDRLLAAEASRCDRNGSGSGVDGTDWTSDSALLPILTNLVAHGIDSRPRDADNFESGHCPSLRGALAPAPKCFPAPEIPATAWGWRS